MCEFKIAVHLFFQQINDHSDDSLTEDISKARPLSCILRALGSVGSDNKWLDGSIWDDNVYSMTASMFIIKDVGVRMMKYYFKIKASKTSP